MGSLHNYVVSYKSNYLIYNALNSTCVILDKREYKNFDFLSVTSTEVESYLKLGLYVEDNYNEVDAVCYSSRCLTDKNKNQFYRIYTTLKCNAKCSYCYQKKSNTISMSEKTADDVCKFIIDRMIDNSGITIEWFGGEPLLNEQIINYICNKLVPICNSRKIKFNSRMVSNGYLINHEIVKSAIDIWSLSQIQITLDGLDETYEKKKKFNDVFSFQRVISNIKLLLDNNIRVSVRLNYDESNYKEILELISFLGKNFSNYNKINIYARKIMAKNIDNSLKASEYTDLKILEKCIQYGFVKNIINSIPRRHDTCVAHMLHSFMILPDGKIGKCSQAISNGDIIGDVLSGINDKKVVRWCSPRLNQECLDCKLLPICNGGCLYEKFANKNFCFASEKIIMFKLMYYLQNYVKSKANS